MEQEITWQGPTHIHTEKGKEWYWSFGIISLGLMIAAILLKNYIFAILIIISAFALMLFAGKKPKEVEITFSDKGLLIDTLFYPYPTLESFCVHGGDVPRLILKSKKVFMPFISLPIHEIDPEELRDFLLDFLKEEDMDDTFFHKVMERLGF